MSFSWWNAVTCIWYDWVISREELFILYLYVSLCDSLCDSLSVWPSLCVALCGSVPCIKYTIPKKIEGSK